METQQAYNAWAAQYDTNDNKTRDLEAVALRKELPAIDFTNCLEIGCGTGKNTIWLKEKAKQVTAVDFSTEMLAQAKSKIKDSNVHFVQADINQPWNFHQTYDLITFSLVLEHIENLPAVFSKAAAALQPGGYLYLGELHPFKQYAGSKARFETSEGTRVLQCFTHHISDFVQAGIQSGLSLYTLHEYFDNDERNEIPRILTILLRKS